MNTGAWTKKEILIISAVFFGSIGFSGLLIKLIKPNINAAALLMDSILVLSTFLILRFFLKKKRVSWSEFGFKELKFKNIVLSFLAMFFVTFVGGYLSSLLSNLLGLESQSSDMKEIFNSASKLWVILNLKIGAGILAPLVEEIFFRGLIFKYIRQKRTFIFSAVSSSLLFSLMHFDIGLLPFTFILGFTTAYMFEKTQNIFYPFLIHMGANNFAANMVLMGIL